MAEKVKAKSNQDESTMMATYAAVFFLLWYMIVRVSRALVCAVWPIYLLAAIGTVQLLQLYRPEEIVALGQEYYKQIHDIVMKEYQKYAPYFSHGKK